MENKNILVVSTSMRQGKNSDIIADYFIKGAVESGHQKEKVSLAHLNLHFCKGCLVCQETRSCVINDEANAIVNKIIK